MADQTNGTTSAVEAAPFSEPVKVEGTGTAPVAGAETKEKVMEEAPAQRTYSEDEWNKRQSSWDKQQASTAATLKELETARDEMLAKLDESETTQFLKTVEADGGDMDVAKQIALRDLNVRKATRALEETRKRMESDAAVLAQSSKIDQANKLIKEHSLTEDTLAVLMESGNVTDMENKALKLRLEKSGVEQRKPADLASTVSSTRGRELPKNPSLALGTLMEEETRK